MNQAILPGATLGVLGSGQLGRMFAIAARRMGYRVHVLSPDTDTPTGQVADLEITTSYDDLDAIAEFARGVSVMTFEFENVPSATTEAAARHAPVRPDGSVLHTTQHRLREKTFLRDAGLPVTPFLAVRNLAELETGLQQFGDSVLKTAAWGYDGKGQMRVSSPDQAASAWATLKTDEAILEQFISFAMELSVVAVRGLNGEFAWFEPMANTHWHHILDLSIAPAPIEERIRREAVEIARAVVEKLDVVGVLCVEMFLTTQGQLLINELAPRPHNSGHLTIDGFVSCQFEQQVRGVCGLPLGSTRQTSPSAMVNLLGDLWQDGPPNWPKALSFPNVKLHLYGKHEARPGRKMGHLTALADTVDEAVRTATAAREALLLQ